MSYVTKVNENKKSKKIMLCLHIGLKSQFLFLAILEQNKINNL